MALQADLGVSNAHCEGYSGPGLGAGRGGGSDLRAGKGKGREARGEARGARRARLWRRLAGGEEAGSEDAKRRFTLP